MKKIVLTSIFIWLSGWLLAQERTVSGIVTSSADGQPLPGVTVAVKGSTRGDITDANGRYSLASVPDNATLVYSFVGFAPQEVAVGSRSTIDIKLVSDVSELSEVVVTGYGAQLKKESSGSIATVKGETIQSVPLGSFDQILQGQAPGLLVQSNSGQPGAAARVVIRGVGSVNGSTDPLYVVDGVQISAANFATLNQGDFESVSVLKDASATAIYGSRGANGVVVITTRQGKAGKTRFEYSGQYGQSRFPDNPLKLMNSNEKIDYELRRGITDLADYTAEEIAALRTVNTNWQNEVTQTGITHQHQLSASGGNDKTTFYVSGNLFAQTGTLKRTGLDRYTGRVNLMHNAGAIQFGINTQLGWGKFNNTTEDNAGINSPLNAIRWANPYETPYDADGKYTRLASGQPNPVRELNEADRKINELKGVGNAFIEYDLPFLSGLTVRTNWGADYEDWDQTLLFTRFGVTGLQQPGRNGSLQRRSRTNVRFTGTTSLRYTKTFGNHAVSVALFQEVVQNKFRDFRFTGYGLTGNSQNEIGITPGSTTNPSYIPAISGAASRNAILSYFATGTYGFKDKYFLNLTVRRDGSSRFGSDFRYATFGAAGVSWSVTDEEFMSGLKNGFLDYLKLKASYGSAGNQDFTAVVPRVDVTVGANNRLLRSDFPSLELFGNASYDGGQGVSLSQLENPELTWEQRNTLNVGTDFALFKNRVSGSVEFYNALTTRLLLSDQLSRTTGFEQINRNVGSLRNRGVEIALNTNNIVSGGFRWTTGLNFTYNRNEVISLTPSTQADGLVGEIVVTRVGYPINSNFLVDYAGVNPLNGNAQYRKPSGEITEEYDPADRQIFGPRDAPYFGGFTNVLAYKGLELSALFSFVAGSEVYNNDRVNLENPDYLADNVSRDLLREWQKPGDITDIPRPSNTFQSSTTRFLEDGSFLRLRNLMLSYSLPESILKRTKLTGVRFFVQGQNLLTVTNFRGFDPELAQGQLTGAQYPALRIFMGGINIGL